MQGALKPEMAADLIAEGASLMIGGYMGVGSRDCKYRPSPLLKRMVHAGYPGRKSGRGFADRSRAD